MSRASSARRIAAAAVYGGGGLAGLGIAGFGVLMAEARIARGGEGPPPLGGGGGARAGGERPAVRVGRAGRIGPLRPFPRGTPRARDARGLQRRRPRRRR